MSRNIIESFQNFFQEWLIRQDQNLEELIQAIETNNINNSEENTEASNKELIRKILDHCSEYFRAKGRVAQEDVFLLFNPPWLSSYEKCYLWLSGFRPALAFRLLLSSSNYNLELDEDQFRRINLLQEEIKEEVQQLTDAFAGVQRGMTPIPAAALAETLRHVRNEAAVRLDSTVDTLRATMEALVECADYLRRKTIVKILDILTSSQSLRFLAAAIQFQLSIRRYGQLRDADRPRPNVAP